MPLNQLFSQKSEDVIQLTYTVGTGKGTKKYGNWRKEKTGRENSGDEIMDKQKIIFLSFSLSIFLSIASILFYFLPFFFHFIWMLIFHLSPYNNMLLRLFHVVFFPHFLKFFLFSFSLTVTCLQHESERMIKSKRTLKKGERWIKPF
jgi:hypothetical protein